jgi:uncharacterized protein (TIGR02217 family)
LTVFRHALFPPAISFGSSGGPKFKTTLFAADSGYEQRIATWRNLRAEYEVGHNVKTREQMDEVRAFFLAVGRGRAYPFRFKDWNDYQINQEIIATGDGVAKAFQITKTYNSTQSQSGAEHAYVRKLTKIAWDTVAGVAVDEVVMVSPDDYSVDEDSGIITFVVAPAVDAEIKIGHAEFHVPVRFDIDHFSVSYEEWEQLSAPSIPLIEVRDWRYATGELIESDAEGGGIDTEFPDGADWYMHFAAETYFDGSTFVTEADVVADPTQIETNGYRIDNTSVANQVLGLIGDALIAGEFTLLLKLRWERDPGDDPISFQPLTLNNNDISQEWDVYTITTAVGTKAGSEEFNADVSRSADNMAVQEDIDTAKIATVFSATKKLAVAMNGSEVSTSGAKALLGGATFTGAFLGTWDSVGLAPASGPQNSVAWIEWIAAYPVMPAADLVDLSV